MFGTPGYFLFMPNKTQILSRQAHGASQLNEQPSKKANLTDNSLSAQFAALATEHSLLKQKLKKSPRHFSFTYSGKLIELKSANEKLEQLYAAAHSFSIYKDAIARSLFIISLTDQDSFESKTFVPDLYLIFDFFSSLENDLLNQ